jgi:hypothetical protein
LGVKTPAGDSVVGDDVGDIVDIVCPGGTGRNGGGNGADGGLGCNVNEADAAFTELTISVVNVVVSEMIWLAMLAWLPAMFGPLIVACTAMDPPLLVANVTETSLVSTPLISCAMLWMMLCLIPS